LEKKCIVSNVQEPYKQWGTVKRYTCCRQQQLHSYNAAAVGQRVGTKGEAFTRC